MKERYVEYLKENIAFIKQTDRPLVLYGTLEMAYYAKLALCHMKKEITAYCDANPACIGRKINGKEILAFDALKENYPDAVLIICSFNAENVKLITKKLLAAGYADCINGCVLYYYYQLHVMKRNVDATAFAETVYMQQNKEEYIVVGKSPGNLPIVITEKCNLRCRDCGVMTPYYEHPKNYEKEFLIQSIQAMAESVDLIETLNIIGGETFLHPDLVEVCKAASEIPNIFSIMIVTNGAVRVKEGVYESLASCVNSINISDYEAYSPYKNEIYQKSLGHNIYCGIFSDDAEWTRFYPPVKQNRSQEENEKIFQNCYWAYYVEKIINGEFHVCDFSAAIAPFHILKDKECYLDLMEQGRSAEEKREKVKKLLHQTKTIEACDYCRYYLREPTKRAMQVKGTLKIEE